MCRHMCLNFLHTFWTWLLVLFLAQHPFVVARFRSWSIHMAGLLCVRFLEIDRLKNRFPNCDFCLVYCRHTFGFTLSPWDYLSEVASFESFGGGALNNFRHVQHEGTKLVFSLGFRVWRVVCGNSFKVSSPLHLSTGCMCVVCSSSLSLYICIYTCTCMATRFVCV